MMIIKLVQGDEFLPDVSVSNTGIVVFFKGSHSKETLRRNLRAVSIASADYNLLTPIVGIMVGNPEWGFDQEWHRGEFILFGEKDESSARQRRESVLREAPEPSTVLHGPRLVKYGNMTFDSDIVIIEGPNGSGKGDLMKRLREESRGSDRVILVDDVATYDYTRLGREILRWRKAAYGPSLREERQQVVISSHLPAVTNMLYDLLTPPADGRSALVHSLSPFAATQSFVLAPTEQVSWTVLGDELKRTLFGFV